MKSGESMERVLIIDDDVELCQLVARFLVREGFDAVWALRGATGVHQALAEGYSLILLDVMMPDMDGFEALLSIRRHSRAPVLMLTARGETYDRIRGLEMGADDYLPKPFEPAELVARIRAILRRSPPRWPASPAGAIGDLELDGGTRSVRRRGALVDLTSVEFDLLAALTRAAGNTVSRVDLVREVLGREF